MNRDQDRNRGGNPGPSPGAEARSAPAPGEPHEVSHAWPVPAWLWFAPPLLAFTFFLIYVVQIRSLPFFNYLVANPLAYDLDAQQLLKGVPGAHPFFLSALYPAFVALLYRLSGQSRFFVVICQGLLMAANVWLLGRIARRLFGEWTALGASLIITFYWSFYYFGGELVPATIFMTLILIGVLLFIDRGSGKVTPLFASSMIAAFALALVYATPGLRHLGDLLRGKALAEPARLYWSGIVFFAVLSGGTLAFFLGGRRWLRARALENLAASGAVLGVSTLLWSGAAIMMGLLTLKVAFERGRKSAGAAAMVAGFLIPICASLAHNYVISGDLIPVTTSFGVNVFLGNNPASDGMDPFELGPRSSVRIEADKLRLSGKQRSDFFLRQALDFIKTQPGAWIRLEARKLLISVARTQVNNNADIAERRAAWKRLFVPRLDFGMVFPLACVGIAGVFMARRQAIVLVLGYLSFLAVGPIFFVCERFRLPAIAFLIPLAAYGIETIVRDAAHRRPRGLVLSAVLLSAAGLVSNVDFLSISNHEMPAITGNKAYVERMAGNVDAARRLALHALSLDPHNAAAQFQLGAIEDRSGNKIEALTYYLDTLENDPFFFVAYDGAARILDAVRIGRPYLDAYVDKVLSGGDAEGAKANLIEFVKRRLP